MLSVCTLLYLLSNYPSMTQQNTSSTTNTLITIVKWILFVFIGFMILALLFSGAFISCIIFLLIALLLFPPLTIFWRSKLPFLKNRILKATTLFVLFIIGIIVSPDFNMPMPSERNFAKKRGLDFDDKEKVLIKYLKSDTTDKSIKNIALLGEVGNLFNNGNYSLKHPHDGYIKEITDTIENIKMLQFNPRFRFDERNLYLKNDAKNGKLKNYVVNFRIDSLGKITSKKTYITYSKAGRMEFINAEVPDFDSFVDQSEIDKKKAEIVAEKLLAKEKEAYEERKKKFEKNCLSSWDGSHIELKNLIKDNVNDTDSFDHVETLYKLYKGYAVVIMKFRAKNAFNATILNSVTAKVKLEDCSIIEIEQ